MQSKQVKSTKHLRCKMMARFNVNVLQEREREREREGDKQGVHD